MPRRLEVFFKSLAAPFPTLQPPAHKKSKDYSKDKSIESLFHVHPYYPSLWTGRCTSGPPTDSQCLTTDEALDAQLQSHFFFCLPPEIRTKIYLEVFGHQILHMVRKPTRLGFKRCSTDESRHTCYASELWGVETLDGLWKDSTDGGLLSPMLSCRKM
jgi:hypothetical protein